MPSQSNKSNLRGLRDRISMGIGDSLDSIKGTIRRDRERKRARDAAEAEKESVKRNTPSYANHSVDIREGVPGAMAAKRLSRKSERALKDLGE